MALTASVMRVTGGLGADCIVDAGILALRDDRHDGGGGATAKDVLDCLAIGGYFSITDNQKLSLPKMTPSSFQHTRLVLSLSLSLSLSDMCNRQGRWVTRRTDLQVRDFMVYSLSELICL